MIDAILHFFHMGGYGVYVFSAYGAMLLLLMSQWLIPISRWKRYLKQQKASS
ncbi:MAG: heme exporter protein CcmD [Gammaproteobacteria bacterium RIFCSPHIGHO2_12_FULL_43_28]|nr:MAG: heme exporter protein CcmD [Gammaproteobacteria bacterium RIFCSPHIGHO2_12_FULL_43_28]